MMTFNLEKIKIIYKLILIELLLFFFIFFIITFIYSIHLVHLGTRKSNLQNDIKIGSSDQFKRADIIDRNGAYVAKSVSSIDIGINPVDIIDPKKLLLNLKLIFPNKDYDLVNSKIEKNKFFWFEKNI